MNEATMAKKETDTATDPELNRQMDAASATGRDVEAVFTLSPDETSDGVRSPEETENLTRRVLERVTNRVGQGEKKLNIFRNIGSFVVSANPSFVKELIAQPEIASAIANRQQETDPVGPVKKREAGSTERPKRSKSKARDKS